MTADRGAPEAGVAAQAAREGELLQLRERAKTGLVAVGLRNVAVRALGLVGNIVLARELLPTDFGVIALAMTIAGLGKFLTNGGLPAALIRREAPPTRAELSSVLGFQLVTASLVMAAIVAGGLSFGGRVGDVVAVMAVSLPIEALRTAPYTLIERDLNYALVARIEVLETVVYNVLAIAAVVAGLGVIGVAVAFAVKPVVGTAVLLQTRVAPLGRPRLSLPVVGPLMRFGLSIQGAWLSILVREQALNLLVASIAGSAALGLWTLALRLAQAVQVLLDTLARVMLSAVARLLEAGEHAEMLLGRGARAIAALVGLAVVALVAPAPALVPILFGDAWLTTSELLPFATATMLIAGSVGSASMAYLWATGKHRPALQASVAQTVVAVALSAMLLPVVGVYAAGIGMVSGALVSAWRLEVTVRGLTGMSVVRSVAGPALASASIAAGGWLATEALEPSVLVIVAALAASLAAYLGLLAVIAPGILGQLWRLLAGALRRR